MTERNGATPTPVFVSVRPHVRGAEDDRSVAAHGRLVMPDSRPLVDRYGRVHDDLRISVTDRCNLRCVLLHVRDGNDVSAPQRALEF